MRPRDIAGAEAEARKPLALRDERAADALGGIVIAMRRHQFQRRVVEREQHAVGAVPAVAPGRRPREQRLVGGAGGGNVAGQDDDMIETGNHGFGLLESAVIVLLLTNPGTAACHRPLCRIPERPGTSIISTCKPSRVANNFSDIGRSAVLG